MLKDRQKSILGATIEAYIRTARPVASRDLTRVLDVGVSPATIRSELLKLDEQGYLEQPHTSAGRIPTDHGYRFFVDYLLTGADLTAREKDEISEAFDMRDEDDLVRELSRAVSHISGMFTAAGCTDDGVFYQTGLASILEEPEFEDQERVRAFAHLADRLDEEIKRILQSMSRGKKDEARIFIGRENPWREARDYAMAVSFWEHPSGFRGFVSMIGPTRADYRKQKAILEEITRAYE